MAQGIGEVGVFPIEDSQYLLQRLVFVAALRYFLDELGDVDNRLAKLLKPVLAFLDRLFQAKEIARCNLIRQALTKPFHRTLGIADSIRDLTKFLLEILVVRRYREVYVAAHCFL
ncbi:MAG: hypothetical protein IJ649_05005 [Oscillospiraceae bacterium]|nr:hypothetical protein [Oscillospiraceae bacterium]